MKSKIISNYVIAAVAGVGLTVGSVAFAVNTMDHNNGGMMGNTTTPTTPTGMHDQATQNTYGGMQGKTTQTGMHGQNAPAGTHNGMATGFDRQNAPCHAATDSKDKKS